MQEAHFKAQMASYNERWDRAFKSRKEQYDHFEQQRCAEPSASRTSCWGDAG